MPNSGERRGDAYEHDLMIAALQPAFEARGLDLRVIDWEDDLAAFDGVSLALLGSSWNYQDNHAAFLSKLDALEACGILVCNSSKIARWNARKTYLRELANKGARTIPTRWLDDVGRDEIKQAFAHFECEKLVVKRQIGAGAEGQLIFGHATLPEDGWNYGHPAMLQPFLPAIAREGELSFIFVDGEFCHALRKRAAPGEYRIQSLYGGKEENYAASRDDIAQAAIVLGALPFPKPLYARIDMLREGEKDLLVMEAELVEPYLYPEQGPQLGPKLANAIAKRISSQ
ncbi:MAG: hypothetical protein ABJP48_03105 [Erythrobacter sp.]